MERINQLRSQMPEPTKDVRLNLSSLLQATVLEDRLKWSVALCAAMFVRDRRLQQAIVADAGPILQASDIGDAQAAAALMGMNTVFYRARHMLDKQAYHQRRAGLRMNRMGAPASSKMQFELCAMACAALAGCEACLKSHEASLLQAGATEDQVHEALRLAAVIQSAAIALDCGLDSATA